MTDPDPQPVNRLAALAEIRDRTLEAERVAREQEQDEQADENEDE